MLTFIPDLFVLFLPASLNGFRITPFSFINISAIHCIVILYYFYMYHIGFTYCIYYYCIFILHLFHFFYLLLYIRDVSSHTSAYFCAYGHLAKDVGYWPIKKTDKPFLKAILICHIVSLYCTAYATPTRIIFSSPLEYKMLLFLIHYQ